jgi:hypothetical protein
LGASSKTSYPASAFVPAVEGFQVSVAPVELALVTVGVEGDDGGTVDEAARDVFGDVMNWAMFDAGEARPWLSTAAT